MLPVSAGPATSSLPQGLLPSTLTIEVPAATSQPSGAPSATRRGPAYVSSGTTSISATLQNPPPGYVQPAAIAVVPGTAPCLPDPLHPGNFVCTLSIKLPPGVDSLSIVASTGGNVLSSQIASLVVAAGQANTFSVVLDAKTATLLIGAQGACQSPLSPSLSTATLFAPYGQPTVVSLTALDAAGKTIAGPGAAAIGVNGSFTNGTVTTGGGAIAYAIDTAAQTVTFTANPGAGASVVTISEKQANAGDGLSFSVSGTFRLAPGPALPANLLATAFSGSPGSIVYETLTLGGTIGPDTFANAVTLPKTASIDGANLPDIDGPIALKFDAGNDLLIGNGGNGTPGDTGNLACVPAGALFGTTPSATAVNFDVDVPSALAYDARDGSVAVLDSAPTSPLFLGEYTQQPTYALTPLANRAIARIAGTGPTSVVALPSLAAGSYAAAVTNGTPSSGTNPVSSVRVQPSGAAGYAIVDPGTIDVPRSLGWDALSGELVVGSYGTAATQYLAFYAGAGPNPVRVTRVSTGLTNDVLAISPDGHIAIAGAYSPEPQVEIYRPAAANRTQEFGPIPFNGTDASGNYLYDVGTTGGTARVTSLTWLSNTKLLAGLATGLAARQGLYVFDISTSTVTANCFDDLTGLPCSPAATQTGFLQTANAPTAVTFKP